MGKGKGTTSKTNMLMIGVLAALVCLLAVLAFGYFDLGYKLELLTYTKISSCEDLKAISEKPDGKYCLTKDIDMAGIEWTPFTFNGVLDGNGHEIINLSITSKGSAVRDTYDGNMISYSTSFAGMFDCIEGATIRNLTLTSVYVDITSDEPFFAGTIAGYMGNSKIINCNVKGDVYLRAHDRIFGVGGVAGYGYGLLQNVYSSVTLVCTDTDRNTKDEQFLGGMVSAGYPDFLNCTVDIDGYVSEHGYTHNGGIIGLYIYYPEETPHKGKIIGNRVYGKITFFEENDNRRAYCDSIVGESLHKAETFEDNAASFRRVEVTNYDAELLPGVISKSFDFSVKEKGRFDLNISYSNAGADATYSLFINDRFYKKVPFPGGEGTVCESVFLDSGKNDVKLKLLPGDGNIEIKDASVRESDKKVSLIIAPHQDDEILAFAGTIQKTLAEGNEVRVLFLTNGDYYGTEYAPVRFAESASALSLLGVDKSDITFLGYGDMTLEAMLKSEDPDKQFRSRSGKTTTYGDSVQNFFDYHTLNTGEPADLTGTNITKDLTEYILACRPDRIYTTSEYEWHSDHKYAFLLTKNVLEKLSKDTGYHPVLLETVIHGEETTWPDHLVYDAANNPVYEEFTNPFPTMKTDLDWTKVKKIQLTDEEITKKMKAIGEFKSQNEGTDQYPGTKDYNYGFCKRDEFYWEISY